LGIVFRIQVKIKFITAFSCFGGSTIALIEHCKLLESCGHDVEMYGDCDWHFGRFGKSFFTRDLNVNSDDVLIFHGIEMADRPKCKKCLLYLHEQGLFDLRKKVTSGYDAYLFVSESQREYHGKNGFLVPNPVFHLVDSGLNSPPGGNIAGVVGTVQQRKRQHVSIQKALEDGRSSVLVFGDKEEEYFKSHIEPLLSDRVIYRGLYDPSDRMKMYNEFDVLYNFSSDESASLVLGECKIIGKPVVKCEELFECELLSNEEISSIWRNVLMSGERIESLVCVVTYNRKDCVGRWLRAWNNANKFGAKIAVLHAHDGEQPDAEEKENILSHSPDFYVPFKNTELKDLQALMLVIRKQVHIPDWDYLFWFTDDMLPMRKSFLEPFVKKIKKPNAGLVAQCYEPRSISGAGAHVRTVAYAITSEVAERLEFPEDGPPSQRPYYFEFGKKDVYEKHLLKQVTDMGKGFELCHSEVGEDYAHWTSFLDWMWDCHLLGHWREYERIYEDQFSAVQKFEGMKTRKETLITMEQCEEMTLVPRKICPIIPTSTAPIENFVWSVFSLLLRSDPAVLEHFIVGINGPDKRTGDTSLQDSKQAFVEELRDMKWNGRDMPVTLVRTWSRIGHAQTIEQCIPWAHTEFYVSMHDDVIILDDKWCSHINDFHEDDRLICKTFGPPIHQKLNGAGDLLGLTHFNSIFTLCKKSRMKAINASWVGYHVPMDFQIDNLWNYDDFIKWHEKHGIICDRSPPKRDHKYNVLSMDIGCCFIPEIMNKKYRMGEFPNDSIRHFSSMSWCEEGRRNRILEKVHKEVVSLEREIMKEKQFWDLYLKYVDPRIKKKAF
jgi:hypothetical protein